MLGDAARAAGGTGDPMIVDAIDVSGDGADGGEAGGVGAGGEAVVDDTIVDVAPATDTVVAGDPAPATVAAGSAAGGPDASAGGVVVSTSSADDAAATGPTGAYGLGGTTAPRCCVFFVTT